jgi:hypothetical protein
MQGHARPCDWVGDRGQGPGKIRLYVMRGMTFCSDEGLRDGLWDCCTPHPANWWRYDETARYDEIDAGGRKAGVG